MSGSFYLAIVNTVLFFGLETWVVTPYIRRVLGGLNHQVERMIEGKQPHQRANGGWYFPKLEEVMR